MKYIANIIYNFSNIELNNKMMKIVYIYVRIIGYLLQMINIHWCRKVSAYSMLAQIDLNDISIDTLK